ncbi:MAG: glycine zipper 2TM domain-containing protein [Vitreimonas sp.]
MKVKNWIVAGALALSGMSFAPSSASAEGTQLSQCMHNALLGAGAGALAGALLSHHRLRGAALGAAVGGVGTYGVCRLLSSSDRSRVERNYDRALDGDRRVTDNWGGSNGKYLTVNRPTRAGDGCRRVTAHISDPNNGSQDLPPETYCRNSQGQWVPS